jgi:hypothetical protein
VESLGDSWKNQGLGLAISARAYFQNNIPKFENLFGKEVKGIIPRKMTNLYALMRTQLSIDQK